MTDFFGFSLGERVEWIDLNGRRTRHGAGIVDDTITTTTWRTGCWVPVRFDNGYEDGINPDRLRRLEDDVPERYHGFYVGERVYWDGRGTGEVIPDSTPSSGGITLSDYSNTSVPIRFDDGYVTSIRAEAVETRCPIKRGYLPR